MERVIEIVLAVTLLAFCTLMVVGCVTGIYALARWLMR